MTAATTARTSAHTSARLGSVIASLLLLGGCTSAPTPSPTPAAGIDRLVFSQYQAILDFDDSEYTQDDPAEVARFTALLDEFAVTPGVTVTTIEDNCAGGLSTTVDVVYDDGGTEEMFIATCGEPKYDEFNQQASDLFSEWRADLSHK